MLNLIEREFMGSLTKGSWRREKEGSRLEEEIKKERLDGKEERDSMADLVLDRESNDMEGACSEVGVEVEDGVMGSECSDILEKRERIY